MNAAPLFSAYDQTIIDALKKFRDRAADLYGDGILAPISYSDRLAERLKGYEADRKAAEKGSPDLSERLPLDSKEKAWLDAMPHIPFQDMVAAVLHRDQKLLEETRIEKIKKFSTEIDEVKTERASLAAKAKKDIRELQQKIANKMEELRAGTEQWEQRKPKDSWSANVAAYIMNKPTPAEAHQQAQTTWSRQIGADVEKLKATIEGAQNVRDNDLRRKDSKITRIEHSIEQENDRASQELKDVTAIGLQLLGRATACDGDKIWPVARQKIATSQNVTDTEWQSYRTSCILFGTLASTAANGMASLKFVWASSAFKEDADDAVTSKFLAAVDKQMPDDIWLLDQARRRLKKATSDSTASGAGGRERTRSTGDDADDLEQEARERTEKELRKRQEETRQEERRAAEENLQYFNIQLALELHRMCEEIEARNRIEQARHYERSRDYGRSM